MALLKVRDREVSYHLGSEGKPLLVLICGYAGDMNFHWQVLAPLLEPHYQLLMFDHRGAGKTKDLLQPFNMERLADDAMELVAALGLKNPNFFGFSMGGFVALEIAKKYGDQIGKVVLCNTACKLPEKARIVFQGLMDLLREGVDPRKVLWNMIPWLFSEKYLSYPKHVVQLKKAFEKLNISIEGMERQLAAMLQFEAAIGNNAAWIASREDILIPSHNKDALFIEGGHSACVEEPQKISALIKQFIRS